MVFRLQNEWVLKERQGYYQHHSRMLRLKSVLLFLEQDLFAEMLIDH